MRPTSRIIPSKREPTSYLNCYDRVGDTLWMVVYSNLFSSSLSKTMHLSSTKSNIFTRQIGLFKNWTTNSYIHFYLEERAYIFGLFLNFRFLWFLFLWLWFRLFLLSEQPLKHYKNDIINSKSFSSITIH